MFKFKIRINCDTNTSFAIKVNKIKVICEDDVTNNIKLGN